jgi:hypothetical protein
METIIGSFSIESTGGNELIIKKDGVQVAKFDADGHLWLEYNNMFEALHLAKLFFEDTTQGASGLKYQAYCRGQKFVISGLSSDGDRYWTYFDFDDYNAGWQKSTNEPG